MQQFMNRVREMMAGWMAGRYGSDQLGMTMAVAALVMTVVGALIGVPLITYMADALLIVMVIRMMSRDRYRRAHENQVYLEKTLGVRRNAAEAMNRFKNRKQFCYFRCPQCRKHLRVPRGVGKVTITCRECGTKFDKKA